MEKILIVEQAENFRHLLRDVLEHQRYAVVETDHGEILVSQRVHAEIDGRFATETLGEVLFRGMARPQLAYRVLASSETYSVHTVGPR